MPIHRLLDFTEYTTRKSTEHETNSIVDHVQFEPVNSSGKVGSASHVDVDQSRLTIDTSMYL